MHCEKKTLVYCNFSKKLVLHIGKEISFKLKRAREYVLSLIRKIIKTGIPKAHVENL